MQAQVQSPYPSPPPSNGYHAPLAVGAGEVAFAAVPPPPPLAPKPPREYIEETQHEDVRTYAQLEALDRQMGLDGALLHPNGSPQLLVRRPTLD